MIDDFIYQIQQKCIIQNSSSGIHRNMKHKILYQIIYQNVNGKKAL